MGSTDDKTTLERSATSGLGLTGLDTQKALAESQQHLERPHSDSHSTDAIDIQPEMDGTKDGQLRGAASVQQQPPSNDDQSLEPQRPPHVLSNLVPVRFLARPASNGQDPTSGFKYGQAVKPRANYGRPNMPQHARREAVQEPRSTGW